MFESICDFHITIFYFKDIFYSEVIFNGFFIVDSFGSFLKSLILIGAGLIFYFYLTVNNPKSLKDQSLL